VARTDKKDAQFLGLVLRTAISGTAALIIAAAATGAWVVPLVLGDAYRSAGLHLAYGMILVLPFGVATIANQILIAHDRTWEAMASAVIGAAAMTVLVQRFMPVGGTVANYFLCVFGGMLVWSTVGLALLSRWVAVNWSQCLVKPALASGLSVGLYYALVGAIGAWNSLVTALLVLIVAQRLFNIVDRQERAALSQYVLARVRRGPPAQ
jgi:O-antigen/teichoic acid export membrane protein